MNSRYFTDGEGTVLDRDGGSTLPEVVVECGDMALAERIAAALELQNDIETLDAARFEITVETLEGGVLFTGSTVGDTIASAAEWVRSQQEGRTS